MPGHVCGPLRIPPGYDAPLLVDQQFKPPRPYVPLLFVHTVTAN